MYKFTAICPRCEVFYYLIKYTGEYFCGCSVWDKSSYLRDHFTVYEYPDILVNPLFKKLKCKIIEINGGSRYGNTL